MMSSKKESNQNKSFYMAEPKNDEHILSIVNGVLDRRLKDKSYYDVLPRTKFVDNEKLYFGTNKDVALYWDGTNFIMNPAIGSNITFAFAAASNTLFFGIATGDDGTIRANSTDATPKIVMAGNGGMEFYATAGSTVNFIDGSSTALLIGFSSPDAQLSTVANRNIALLPNGSGLVKFGVETTNAGSDRGKLVKLLTAAGDTVYLKSYDLV